MMRFIQFMSGSRGDALIAAYVALREDRLVFFVASAVTNLTARSLAAHSNRDEAMEVTPCVGP